MDKKVLEQLKELEEKIGFDGWNEVEGQFEHPMMVRQKELLKKLQTLLGLQLNEDQEKLRDLREKLNRLKHGGGR